MRPNDSVKQPKIDTFVLMNSCVFVKSRPDAGVTGWGKMLKDDAKARGSAPIEVAKYLVSQDPRRVGSIGRLSIAAHSTVVAR